MWPIVFVLFGCLCQFAHTSSRKCPAAPPMDPSCIFLRIAPGCQTDSDCKTTGTKCCVSDCGVLQCVKSVAPWPREDCPVLRQPPAQCLWFDQQCKSDKDCSNGQICCGATCGTACTNPVTSPTSKPRPGVCPAIRKVSKDFCARAFIVSDCKGKDSDCPKAGQKCCPGLCGALRCQDPITGDRPGCPPFNPDLRCVIFNQQCNADRDCDDGKLCCFQRACGTSCEKKVKPTPTVKPRQGVCPAVRKVPKDFCARALVLSDCKGKDSDCPKAGQKCCPGLCGALQCQDPITGDRPGCPLFNPVLRCIVFNQQCNADRDCDDGKQCCYQPSCGTSCQKKVKLDPSQCPPVRRDVLCKRYNRQCSSNKDCKHGTICCPVDCGTACKLPLKPPGSVCSLPKQPGTCKAYIPRYYYDYKEKKCSKFIYGGCGGNENNFKTLEDCQKRCPEKPDPCSLPKQPGPCRGSFPRYYYDYKEKKCGKFIYGGCGGNENNFKTLKDCQKKCRPNIPGPCPVPICKFIPSGVCTRKNIQIINGARCVMCPEIVPCNPDCLFPKDAGPCEAAISKYYYDTKTRRCKHFLYGGCQGNRNNFNTLRECEKKCSTQPGGNVVKPGRCPKNEHPDLVCIQVVRPGDCINDNSCPGNEKCCKQGCFRSCVNPAPVCGPVCAIFCRFGNVLDDKGCPTCTCKTGCENEAKPLASITCGSGSQRCPGGYKCSSPPSGGAGVCCRLAPVCGPVCAIFCKFGNVLDNKGCPTCNCRTGCKKEAKPLASIRCGSGGQKCPGRYECSSPPSGGAGVCCEKECPLIKCPIPCPFGSVTVNGCPTCKCKPGPCQPPPCARPPPNVCTEPEYRIIDGVKCPWCYKIVPCKPSCEKGNPLKNIQCGLGPGSQTCPQGYYCNSNGNNAVCCQIPCKHGKPHPTLSCGQFVGSNKCPAGYSCLAHPADAYFACCPDGKQKEGFCPPTSGAGICVERCRNDQSCPGRQKCCSNGCGHVCMHPTGGIKPSPAKCPKGKPLSNVFCGRGPTRQDCPQGYSCNIDPTDRFAVCCPDDNSAKCHAGIPLPKINCGRGINREDCPSGFSCNIDPLDRFAVCCPQCDRGTALANTRCGNHTEKCPSGYQCKYKYGICCPELKLCLHCCGPPPCCNTCGLPPPPPQKCPADPRPKATCYHFIKNCKDDSSCPKQKKCCKRRCTYKCLKAV